MKVSRKDVNAVMEAVLSDRSIKQVTLFPGSGLVKPSLRIRATRVAKHSSRHRTTLVFTIDNLNYAERKFVGQKLKAGVKIPRMVLK